MAGNRTEVPKSHGVKRSATDALESEQRLAKRFDLLNLENHGKLYIPVSGRRTSSRPPPRSPDDDFMQVEETKDKIYIFDLEKELAEIESDEETPVFIPDIEKHLNRIPKHVLSGPEPRRSFDNQLVLYGLPNSLSVPEEHDSVRKAIIEARLRIRERQATWAPSTQPAEKPAAPPPVRNGFCDTPKGDRFVVDDMVEDDVDAMDIE